VILISHRGNINGSIPSDENRPEYIEAAIQRGYHVEIDVWKIAGSYFLGHDNPDYKIEESFLKNDALLCHAKSLQALESMLELGTHCFWHQEDWYTVTSKGFIISYPGNAVTERTICMKPELIDDESISRCYGICSDYVLKYRGEYILPVADFNSTR